ncbi:MAG: hypothetical protein KC620_21380 [Myxococcales bacterium]|nr:hypothetical protein [Myxococcales bacterium]
MADRRVRLTPPLLALLAPGIAWAQPASEPAPRPDFGMYFVFWFGAVILMLLVGRVVFREQLGERRTLRRMMREIGPFFPEFDIDAVKRWVHLCAPHVWSGWKRRDMSGLAAFATEDFLEAQNARFAELQRKGHEHAARLGEVLKVHPLGLYPIGEGPPPRNLELMLRLEERAIDCIVEPDGKVIEGREGWRQVQHLWTLRHDGRQWRLDRVWTPTHDVDLRDRPPLPPLMEWKRPPADD